MFCRTLILEIFLLSLYFVINNKQQNSLHDPRYSSFKDSSGRKTAVDVKSSVIFNDRLFVCKVERVNFCLNCY